MYKLNKPDKYPRCQINSTLHSCQGEKAAGINVRKGTITNILEENVVQPLLVSTSSITLASECVRSILKIDDIVNTVRG